MSYYDADRVSHLKEIMPKFVAHARPNDRILMGLRDDPSYPYSDDSRPSATVIKVKNAGTVDATLRVRTDNGAVVDLAAGNIHPKRVWEFDDETYERVLARTQRTAVNATSYRSSEESESFASLRNRIDELSSRLDTEMRDSKMFNKALIQSFSELAGEVSSDNPSAKPFATTFNSEYRSMMGGQAPQKQPSPFDSDFTDSDFSDAE